MQFRYELRIAVTWRIVAELMRRHKDTCRLRVLEIHPGGGMYNCLALGASRGDVHFAVRLCDLNWDSQHVNLGHPYGRPRLLPDQLDWPDNGFDYVTPFLTSPDPKRVVDQMEALLGLPETKVTPSTTPTTLSFRVIAGVLERRTLARERVRFACAWHDSSGMEGCYVEPWIALFPDLDITVRTLPPDGDWRKIAAVAGRLWRLQRQGAKGGVVLDVGTGEACLTGDPTTRVSLWKLFQEGNRDVRPAVDWVDRYL